MTHSTQHKDPLPLPLRKALFLGGIIAASIIRICLATTQSYWAIGGYYDDALQNIEALNLIQGNWLGAYGQTTLIKGIAFPLFLALRRFLHIPYGTALGLFICLSCIIFLLAISKICKNKIALFAAFILLLFCPIAWCSDAGVRIYRNVLSPWTTLILFSCLLALFHSRHEKITHWVPWAIILGLSLAFMVNLREDSAWAYPAIIATLLIVVAINVWHSPRDIRWKRLLSCTGIACIPLAICVASLLGVAALNHHYYGVFLVNDRTDGPFAEMVEDITAIQDDNKNVRDQWFTREMLSKAIDNSPKLGSIEDEIWEAYESWSNHFDGDGVKGDYLQWVLRSAMTNAGVYETAPRAHAFAADVVRELNEVFASGGLERDSLLHPSSQGPGISLSDCMSFLPEVFANCQKIVGFSTIEEWFPLYTSLDEGNLGVYQQTTGLSFSDQQQDQGYVTNKIERGITRIYQILSPILLAVGIIALIALFVLCAKKRLWKAMANLTFDAVLILGSAFLLVCVVSVFIAFLGGSWPLQFYATPAYILFLVFDAVIGLQAIRLAPCLPKENSRGFRLARNASPQID